MNKNERDELKKKQIWISNISVLVAYRSNKELS